MKKERLFYLDLIRSFSFLLIFFYHFQFEWTAAGISGSALTQIAPANGTLGNVGVSLFFMISGAALMYTYEESLSLKRYLVKRARSLFPMFWIAWLLLFLRFDCMTGSPFGQLSPRYLVWTVLGMDGYLNGIVPTFYRIGEWFLGCILLLYLLFPLLRRAMLRFPKLLPAAVLLLYALGTYFYRGPIDADRFFLFRIPDLLLGMYFVRGKKTVTLPAALVCLSIHVLFSVCYLPLPLLLRMQIWGASLFFLLVYLSTFLRSAWMQKAVSFLSGISYPAFLLHHVVIRQIAHSFSGQQMGGMRTLFLLFYAFLITVCLSVGLRDFTRNCLKKRADGKTEAAAASQGI